jgi:hypothetical protein
MTAPIAWWKADNNIVDSVSGITGTCKTFFGVITTMDYEASPYGTAFKFSYDGSSYTYAKRWYCGYGDGNIIQFAASDDFSIRLKFKVSAWPTNTPTTQLIIGDTSYNKRTWEILITAEKRIQVVTNTGSFTTDVLDIDLGEWYDLLLTHDGTTGVFTLYIDSSLIYSEALTYASASTSGYEVGGHAGGTGSKYFFAGSLDEIRLYDAVISPDNDDTGIIAGKKLLQRKNILGFKIETIPFITETLAAEDYGTPAYDIKISPSIESYAQGGLCSGDFSRFRSISGKRACAVNFKVDAYAKVDPATSPTYFTMLRACGWKQITHGSTGVSVRPDSFYCSVPATIEAAFEDESDNPRQLVYRISGAMGAVKLYGKPGLPLTLEFSFLGALDAVFTRAYANRIVPEGFDDEFPKALLLAESWLLNYSVVFRSFEIAGNEVVNLFSNIFKGHGYDGSRVAGRSLYGTAEVEKLDV